MELATGIIVWLAETWRVRVCTSPAHSSWGRGAWGDSSGWQPFQGSGEAQSQEGVPLEMKTWRTQCSDPQIYTGLVEQCRPLYFPCSSKKTKTKTKTKKNTVKYRPSWEYIRNSMCSQCYPQSQRLWDIPYEWSIGLGLIPNASCQRRAFREETDKVVAVPERGSSRVCCKPSMNMGVHVRLCG